MRYNNINVYAVLFCGLAHAIFTSSNLKQIFCILSVIWSSGINYKLFILNLYFRTNPHSQYQKNRA